MCYSNTSTSQLDQLKERYKIGQAKPFAYQPTFFSSGFDHPIWPIVTVNQELQGMQWGLIPNWFKGDDALDFAKNTLNAKSETLHEKPSFAHLIDRNRCLIPSTGFFEFQSVGKEKIPYFIYSKETPIFSMAGIYDTWHHPKTGEIVQSFSMITCEANELMATIHNTKKRMPVILKPGDEDSWLTSGKRDLLCPMTEGWLTAHTVNKKMLAATNPHAILPFIPDLLRQKSLFD